MGWREEGREGGMEGGRERRREGGKKGVGVREVGREGSATPTKPTFQIEHHQTSAGPRACKRHVQMVPIRLWPVLPLRLNPVAMYARTSDEPPLFIGLTQRRPNPSEFRRALLLLLILTPIPLVPPSSFLAFHPSRSVAAKARATASVGSEGAFGLGWPSLW